MIKFYIQDNRGSRTFDIHIWDERFVGGNPVISEAQEIVFKEAVSAIATPALRVDGGN